MSARQASGAGRIGTLVIAPCGFLSAIAKGRFRFRGRSRTASSTNPAFCEPFDGPMRISSVQRVLHAAERVVQVRSQALHDRDDRDRDAGGDEAILDGGRARLVLHEALNEGLHSVAPYGSTVWLSELCPPGLVLCPILTSPHRSSDQLPQS